MAGTGDICMTCGGLIMEPGVAYGYTGKICHCIVLPKIQKPATEFRSAKEFEIETKFITKPKPAQTEGEG